ncbi:MAG: GWxTD domain-containing protein [Candidatus Aminicenantaceae bacterium]
MKKTAAFVLFLLLSLMISGEPAHQKTQKRSLPERFANWLEEEVVYIIAPLEEEVFLQLQSDRERDLFIQAFWAQRDPSKGDNENEFRKEHNRRINYANQYFGRATPKAGWKTARGRMYIILGEPNDRIRFEGKNQVYNTEVWFYQGLSKVGLPPGFNLVFFQQGGVGEYILYSPLKDGPMALLTSDFGDQTDHLSAYRRLRDREPELANFSLSLIPGEGPDISGRPSMTSDILLQRIETTPMRTFKDKYARKFLDYKDIVEVEYTANYIDSDSLVKVIKDPSGIYFVHYAIEPERLSVNQINEKYYTVLKLNGSVSDLDGETIHQFEKEIRLEFDKEQIQQISQRPLGIRDMFPLIPGTYKVSILVKNEISKEFTSLERNLLIPSEKDSFQMTSILMGYKKRDNPPPENRLRPFQMGKYQIYFHAKRVFLMQDELVLTFQIHGMSQELKDRGELKYTFLKNDKEFKSFTKRITEYDEVPDFVEQISLQEFFPAHYRVRVTLQIEKQEVLFETDEFDVTHVESIARPWIYSQLLAATDDPAYAYIIGQQFFNSGKLQDALEYLENAYSKKPDNEVFALGLSRIYAELKEYTKIVPILEPLMNLPESPSYDVHFLMGASYRELGEFGKAIEVFDKAIQQFGVNPLVLNALGGCYYRWGQLSKALTTWEKSLEINPEQPEIRKNVKAIKEKR